MFELWACKRSRFFFEEGQKPLVVRVDNPELLHVSQSIWLFPLFWGTKEFSFLVKGANIVLLLLNFSEKLNYLLTSNALEKTFAL